MSSSRNNLSILYLALLCVLYYLLIAGVFSPKPLQFHSEETVYIEIEDKNGSTIQILNRQDYLDNINSIYAIDITNGTKLILNNDSIQDIQRISGIKSISLGIPIGLNSASEKDLTALPGIGNTLAGRIVEYRELSGGFKNLSELDNVEGIGDKTLLALKGKISLD